MHDPNAEGIPVPHNIIGLAYHAAWCYRTRIQYLERYAAEGNPAYLTLANYLAEGQAHASALSRILRGIPDAPY